MSIARLAREKKRQLGQFFTPADTARAIIEDLKLLPSHQILEPSFGEGAFILAIVEQIRPRTHSKQWRRWLNNHLHGCELDGIAYENFRKKWEATRAGEHPKNLAQIDFFRWMPPNIDCSVAIDRDRYFTSKMGQFDFIVGNPPFGGSIDPHIQDSLDSILGVREGRKIKKETYAFFIVKCMDLLKPGGQLVFICSDTILTISTMSGLRAWLQNNYEVTVSEVPGNFSDTSQGMILLTVKKRPQSAGKMIIFGSDFPVVEIERTPNHSWRINDDLSKYFTGVAVGDKMVATSGMTVGKNDLFVRRIHDNRIEEPYAFRFEQQKITLEDELACARLGKISDRRREEIAQMEAYGETKTVVKWSPLKKPKIIKLPHPDYLHYNKAISRILYATPRWVIFWRNDGEHVYTFKKSGNWYLHGVGGKKYFGREGLTWSLIAPRLHVRYLPSGYILDSGAPCAFLRPGVERDELFFILGWSLTGLCNRILKEVLNHTRNNQGKDFERLPYPVWVSDESKRRAVRLVKKLVGMAKKHEFGKLEGGEKQDLENLYAWPRQIDHMLRKKKPPRQMGLILP